MYSSAQNSGLESGYEDVATGRLKSSRRTRRPQAYDAEYNANNSNNVDLDLARLNFDSADIKSPGKNRKSKLIEAMAANFEKNNTDSPHPALAVSSSAYCTLNGNGDSIPVGKTTEAHDSPPEIRKSGPSARRGKMQREKRQLRQKRRSTGVVNKKDVEESENAGATDAEKKLQSETDTNTLTNELSPVSSYEPNTRITTSQTESITLSYTSKVDGVQGTSVKLESPRISRKSAADSPRVNRKSAADSPRLSRRANADSPRLHRKSNMTMNSMMQPANQHEIEEFRAKLQSAEQTIEKLRKKITVMDHELHSLEEENDQLKRSNKMLEDENATMLRLMRR